MANYGIDLGTSSCLVARIDEGFDDEEFELRCLPDDVGQEMVPSVVSFLSEDEYVVGEKAHERMNDMPDSTVELIKIRLGKTDVIPIIADGHFFQKTPQEITSLLIKHLIKTRGPWNSDPVLTIPAYFEANQKEATKQAGEIAGIKTKTLIEEPTAAILYQIYSDYCEKGPDAFSSEKNKNVLVFDFGGGTLDLSIVHIEFENGVVKPQVLGLGGDPSLGGNLIDFLFTDLVIESMRRRYNDDFVNQLSESFKYYFSNYLQNGILAFEDGTNQEIKSTIFRLKRHLESVKKSLTHNESAKIVLWGNYSPIPINRETFEKRVLQHDSLNIRKRIRKALEDLAKDTNCEINEVLLVGGSSQIPYVKEVIIETLNEKQIPPNSVKLSKDFSTAVAKGAAIHAALVNKIAVPPFMTNSCTSVVARDIVLECGKGQSNEVFIRHGTKYPFDKPKEKSIFVPHALSESIPIRLKEIVHNDLGYDVSRNIAVYQYFLPIFYTGDEIKVSVSLNDAGLFTINAKHLLTGEDVNFESQKDYILSGDEINKAYARIQRMSEKQ